MICAASSVDFMGEAGTGSHSPGHHSPALTRKYLSSCLSQLSASSTTAATKQQTCRQSASGLQSLVLRFHILHIKWVWVGLVLARDSHALSQLIAIFRKDKCFLPEFLAVACWAGKMQGRWGDVTLARPGWCGGLGLPQSNNNLMTGACQESKRAAWEERNPLLTASLYGALTEHLKFAFPNLL